ncbi:hypothetical protein AAVH_12840 [Aphelenchoides avenae]|nr:hypothetical protein AAVH_12840 [Aphelenchus avenae]
MSRQLSPLAIIAITESLGRARMDICREWKNLRRRYMIGWPSLLPIESLKSRDEYALSLGRMTESEAIQAVFSSGGPLTLSGTMPKWLIPTVVEKFLSLADVSPSSMRPVHAKDVWGLTENDAWNEIFYSRLQCPSCYRPSDLPEDFCGTYHVVHPTRADWCLTLRFQFWDEKTDPYSCHFKNVELSVEPFLCRPKPGPAADSQRRVLRLAELRNEVFHWLTRARVDKCQLVCKEWRVASDWQQRTLALHFGRITIKTAEQARLEGQQSEANDIADADGFLVFSVVCRLDDSELVEDRRFHLPHDPDRDSALIRNHLRNFFASSVGLDSMQEEWLVWLRPMFAGLQNCHVGSLELFDSTTLGREPRLTHQIVESARPLTPRHVMVELAPTVLDSHLRDGFLSPERLGNFAKVDCYAQAFLEHEHGIIPIEPAWTDDLFHLGDRHVTMWYERRDPDEEFQWSSIANVLLDVATQFEARDTNDFASTFDFKIFRSGATFNAPKAHPDVADVELHDFHRLHDESCPYGGVDFVNHWDAYYVQNSATKDELTILLKRPTEDFAAFRLKRGRMTFEAKANNE